MNWNELQKLTELLRQIKQLDQIQKLTILLEQLRQIKEIADEAERSQWVEDHECLFEGLKPEDWAWLKEKADYDPSEWEKISKELQR